MSILRNFDDQSTQKNIIMLIFQQKIVLEEILTEQKIVLEGILAERKIVLVKIFVEWKCCISNEMIFIRKLPIKRG